MTVGFTSGFSSSFYSGAGVTAATGAAYPVSLGGVPYELDQRSGNEFVHRSIPMLRPTEDSRENASKGTLNPEAFWRRSFEQWHYGAGQTHFDHVDDSLPGMFRRSRGIDVWTRNQFSLLPATDQKRSTTGTNLYLAVAGDYLYATDGTTLVYTQDITTDSPSFTTVTGTSATAAEAVASDGYTVLVANDTDGIYKTTRGAATAAQQITGTVSLVGYAKGRWLAAEGPALYDITSEVYNTPPVALPTAHYTHHNTDWAWTAFAEGPVALYAAGYSGDKSIIYRLTLKDDGTGLNQPVAAVPLPDGETVQSMRGYLGYILIGTTKGVRFAIPGQSGELTLGSYIATGNPVLCLEGQESFVWFGWTNHETISSGLGRLDLTTFTDPDALVPAYASDLMASTGTGDTQAVVTFNGLRVFTVSGSGIWAEDSSTLVSSGTIDTGVFDFGITDPKVSLYVDMSYVSDGGSHSIYLSTDRGDFGLLATHTTETHPVATGEARAHEFELRFQLDRDSTDTSVGPTIRSFALRAHPAPPTTRQIVVPLLIAPEIRRSDGFTEHTDPSEQLQNIVGLHADRQITTYQQGEQSWSVIVDAYDMRVDDVWVNGLAQSGMRGVCHVQMKEVR